MTTTKAERDKTREIWAAATGGEWHLSKNTFAGGLIFDSEHNCIADFKFEHNANLAIHAKAYLRKYANEIDRIYERVYGQEEYVATKLALLLNRTVDLTDVGGGENDPDPLMHLELWVDMVVDKVEELRKLIATTPDLHTVSAREAVRHEFLLEVMKHNEELRGALEAGLQSLTSIQEQLDDGYGDDRAELSRGADEVVEMIKSALIKGADDA